MKKVIYPELASEMARNGETQTELSKLLEISNGTTSNKLSGRTEWTISEIDKICEHYGKDYYELFKR